MISIAVLTYNSEKYLEVILQKLSQVSNDILVVDSGSIDATESIAAKYNCRFLFRRFDDFKSQRTFAMEQCRHKWVLMVDSDEIPDENLIEHLKSFSEEQPVDAYRIPRYWYVLGKKVRAVYPISSPDYPVRLFNKTICNFSSSNVVHEEVSGFQSISVLEGALSHQTFETQREIAEKLERYASLSAKVLLQKGKSLSRVQQWLSSIAAFVKWYFIKGSFRDGRVGLVVGKFAFDYTWLKYEKARKS